MMLVPTVARALAPALPLRPAAVSPPAYAIPSHPCLQRVHGEPAPVYIIPDFLSGDECEALIDACGTLPEVRYIEHEEKKFSIGWLKAAPSLSLLALASATALSLGAGYSPSEALLATSGAVIGVCGLAHGVSTLVANSDRVQIFTGTKWDASGHHAEKLFLARAGALFGHMPRDRFEPVTVTRYKEGEYQRKHVDARLDAMRDEAFGSTGLGQRIAQVIVYLRSPEAGGETAFHGDAFSEWRPRAEVQPVAGQALVFPTATLDGVPDERYVHSGEAVKRGEKWIVGTWLVQE